MEAALDDAASLTGLRTGLVDLDRASGYIGPGDLVIAAARSGVGSTSFALSIAQHVAVAETQPTIVATLDFMESELALRVLACHSHVPLRAIRTGRFTPRERTAVAQSRQRLVRAPLNVSSIVRCGAAELAGRIAAFARKRRARLIVVDSAPDVAIALGEDRREEELALLVRLLKEIARRERTTVLATWRVNQIFERERRREPLAITDLIAGAVEDADVVMLIDQIVDPFYDGPSEFSLLHVNIAKNRHAQPDSCDLAFMSASGSVLNAHAA